MRSTEWSKRALLCVPVVLAAAGLSGCKTLSERYIALEVWKYERCFGHAPPGFAHPAPMAGPPMRTCGQAAPCAAPANACDPCAGAAMGAGAMAGEGVPVGGGPTPVTAGRPVVISDEVVIP